MKHRPELQSHTAKWRRPTRSCVGDIGGATATPQGPLRNQTQGETPHLKSETRTNDGNRQQRHGARGATMRRDRSTRPMQRNG